MPGEGGDESSSDSTSSSSLSGSSSTLSLVHDGEVATHRRIGRPPPDHYPAPMRACHTGPRPDCYWPTLDTCSAHLQARGKGQRKAARHSEGEGGRRPCWRSTGNSVNHYIISSADHLHIAPNLEFTHFDKFIF